jgi:hypothetical protein
MIHVFCDGSLRNTRKRNGSGGKEMEEETKLNMVKQTLCDKKWTSLPSIRLSSFHATFHKDFLSSLINGSDSGLEDRKREERWSLKTAP